MPAAVREAKVKAKAVEPKREAKTKLAEAKKKYPKMLAKAVRDSDRIASVARKGLTAANADAARMKKEAARANRQAFKARVGKLQPNDIDTTARVLKTLLAELRDPA